MKSIKHIFSIRHTVIIGLLFLLSSCFERKFIVTEDIGIVNGEHFIYIVFQTGFDNYILELKTVKNADTTKIFEYVINDALYSKKTFEFNLTRDSLVMFSPFQKSDKFYKTDKGTVIRITHKNNSN